MHRLTQMDDQGNWCLKGLPWEDLYEGKTITGATREKLYGALCRLLRYEETGLSPDRVEELDGLYLEKCEEVNALRKQHQWIPVTERLPEEETWVWVTVSGGFADMGYIDDGWRSDVGDCYDVIAWMPLPEPYQPE